MASLLEHWGANKGFGLGKKRATEEELEMLGLDYVAVAATGAGLGLMSAALGGLDHKVFGFTVPVDGLVSIGLGVLGLKTEGEIGRIIKVASCAAGGSAAVRTFEGFFKRGLHVKGEFEDLGGGYGGMGFGALGNGHQQYMLGQGAVGFGQAEQDRLVNAARYL